ncbi:tRNA dihydrouridine synthase DusB [Corynebacterium cystitidis]|uniref:tRNA-dihydrouridine synthase n=1 Tax=Corynebacterium cystitidis DSM 20524 TaxID=1121357 RepID=A0A1H9W1Z3_9CORY|nr:tRNA dihydrouridine synthase DusB [Corynebacterium cystitidis]WJY82993.1 putative tRNA-dihydrouridine synthase [Corynebacterium cystitidis DSM 20524]SES27925.1 putative TIM-barrel protein, nifR3 family [Corynebacterium cystitidis DSM 20524]SNV64655.1 transcriptional regulator [Corynebacterium cystitidis]
MASVTLSTAQPTLRIGTLNLDSPVILAPMAGVTNMPFRVLCREIEEELTGTSSGLYVCEMITARALVEGNEKTLHMTKFADVETPRSMQLYTVDPEYTYKAVRQIVEQDMADHVDMNFGCPVPKVTRRGGGSAIPYKRRLYGNIVSAAVRAAEGSGIPITVKFRIGIDEETHTHFDAGRIAAEEGAAAVTLHARTAAERYSGQAHWDEITRLVEHMEGTNVPVLGNGDIFAADDAARMMAHTGCAGVEVGRGCLGRPWLFAQLGAQLRGEPIPDDPTLGTVTHIIYRHAELLAEHSGQHHACRDIRKHIGWYLRGYPVGGEVRKELAHVSSLSELRDKLAPWAESDARAEDADGARGRQGSPSKVALPDGWLDDPEDETVPEGAEIENNGG